MATYRVKRFANPQGEIQKKPAGPSSSTPAQGGKTQSSTPKPPSPQTQANLQLRQQSVQVSQQRNQIAQGNLAIRQQSLATSQQRNAIDSARLASSNKQKDMAGISRAKAQTNLNNKPNTSQFRSLTKPISPKSMKKIRIK